MSLIGFGKQTLPNVIKNPFGKKQVTAIRVRFTKSHFSDSFSASGEILFKNGDTEAEQKFEGETFDEVVLKIKACIETL